MTATPTAEALLVIMMLDGAGLVAGSRADIAPRGSQDQIWLGSCAQQWHTLAQALGRGVQLSPARFAADVEQIDGFMSEVSEERRMSAQAAKLIEVYTGQHA